MFTMPRSYSLDKDKRQLTKDLFTFLPPIPNGTVKRLLLFAQRHPLPVSLSKTEQFFCNEKEETTLNVISLSKEMFKQLEWEYDIFTKISIRFVC